MPDQVEKRVEYRVVGDQVGHPYPIGGKHWHESEARRIAFDPPGWPAYTNVRIQERTVTFDPWEDVADV